MPTPELQTRIQASLDKHLQLACQFFKQDFPRPKLSFRQRGKIAGSARLQGNEIRLNPKLLVDNQDAFIRDVVPHELAHLITYQLYGRVRPHGKQWQHIMAEVFGLTPNTTHQFDVSKVQGQTFTYRCQCNQYSLSKIRHNKVLKGQQYVCKRCSTALRYCE